MLVHRLYLVIHSLFQRCTFVWSFYWTKRQNNKKAKGLEVREDDESRWECTGLWLAVKVNCLFAPVVVVCLDYCYQGGLKMQRPRPLRAGLSAG